MSFRGLANTRFEWQNEREGRNIGNTSRGRDINIREEQHIRLTQLIQLTLVEANFNEIQDYYLGKAIWVEITTSDAMLCPFLKNRHLPPA